MIVVNKAKGIVSKDVSRALERRFGPLKLSHAGTLDPLASGVLPILSGHATKLQDYLVNEQKVYSFTVRLGIETDTLDITGKIVREEKPVLPTLLQVNEVLPRFVGDVEQLCPLFSAVKYQGRRLYEYARKGISVPIEIRRRRIKIFSLECFGLVDSEICLRVRCSKGTYVRSLAYDIAEALGTFGVVSSLCREHASGCDVDKALSIEAIEKAEVSELSQLPGFIPVEKISVGLRRVVISCREDLRSLNNGGHVSDFCGKDFSVGDSVLLEGSEADSLFGIGIVKRVGSQISLFMKRSLR